MKSWRDNTSGRRLAPMALIVVLLGAVYLATLLPGVGHSGDTAKFQFVGYVLGTPHATGYPGYVLLSHMFTRLFPLGTVAYRANLLSAIYACGASLFLYGILRELRLDRIPATGTALIFGLTRTFWEHALFAEVYTLHVLFVTSVLYFLLRWSRSGRRSDFIVACALYAFSFGNHLLTLMMLPAFAYFIWITDRRVFTDGRCIAWVTGLILLGAMQYLYFPWRTQDPATPYLEMHARDWSSFLWFVTGGPFRGGMFAYTPAELLRHRIPLFLRETWRQFGPLLTLLPLGLIAKRNVRLHVGMGIFFLANAAYALNYRIPDIEAYFLPNYLLLAIYIGLGVGKLMAWIPARRRHLAVVLVGASMAGLLFVNWSTVDQHARTAKIRETTAMLETVGGNAVIVSPNYDIFEHLMYYDLAEEWISQRVFISHDFDIPDFILYLRGEGDLKLTAQPIRVSPGLELFAAGLSNNHLEELREAGLQAEVIRGGLLYRISLSDPND